MLYCASLAIVGCDGDATAPTPLDAHQAYWSLRLNYHAVNLALTPSYNKVQLAATPLNALGKPIANAGKITFVSHDSTVSVDSAGVVTAIYSTQSITKATYVIARLRYQNVTLADTVAIQVTPTPLAAPLATFQLRPVGTSSTTCNINFIGLGFLDNCGPIAVNATDGNGDTLASAKSKKILIAYASSEPALVQVDQSGKLTESDTGHVTFTASTWAYGVAMQDSLKYVISWPRFSFIILDKITPVNSLTPIIDFSEPVTVIGVGGTVAWDNPFDERTDIVFDDPVNVDSGCMVLNCNSYPTTGIGNVPPFYGDPTGADPSVFAGGLVARSFPVAGTYRYHSSIFPAATGVVYVREELIP